MSTQIDRIRFLSTGIVHQILGSDRYGWYRTKCGLRGTFLDENIEATVDPVTCKRCLREPGTLFVKMTYKGPWYSVKTEE